MYRLTAVPSHHTNHWFIQLWFNLCFFGLFFFLVNNFCAACLVCYADKTSVTICGYSTALNAHLFQTVRAGYQRHNPSGTSGWCDSGSELILGLYFLCSPYFLWFVVRAFLGTVVWPLVTRQGDTTLLTGSAAASLPLHLHGLDGKLSLAEASPYFQSWS